MNEQKLNKQDPVETHQFCESYCVIWIFYFKRIVNVKWNNVVEMSYPAEVVITAL